MKPVMLFLAILAVTSLACGMGRPASTPPPLPSITAPPTLPAGTPLSAQPPQSTDSTPPAAPANTLPAVTVVIPTTPPVPSGSDTMRLNIYMVAVDDNGTSGKKIGCNDSVIPIAVDVPKSQGVLRAALTRLLAQKGQYYGESGLYNALYQSNLTIDSLAVQDGEAVMRFSGQLASGGVCDDPRIIAQLEETALQFSTVQRVSIYVNGTDIHTLLSGQ